MTIQLIISAYAEEGEAVCTDIKIISEEYRPNVYMKRNRFWVEQSDRMITMHDGREKGGTVMTMRSAHKMQFMTWNLL